MVVPSRKVTVPDGAVLPEAGATFAVKVTDCPAATEAAELVRVVVVAMVAGGAAAVQEFEFANTAR